MDHTVAVVKSDSVAGAHSITEPPGFAIGGRRGR